MAKQQNYTHLLRIASSDELVAHVEGVHVTIKRPDRAALIVCSSERTSNEGPWKGGQGHGQRGAF
eukprot:5415777-Prymnesium_polylepis.2